MIAFLPVFITTGRRFIHAFLPWRVQKTPPFCKKCNDKGRVPAFFMGGVESSKWQECECQHDRPSKELPNCKCHVCLDQGQIGKGRPCPHCQRTKKPFIRRRWSLCEKCNKEFIVPENWGDKIYKWCTECYVHAGSEVLRKEPRRRVIFPVHFTGWDKRVTDPYGYLSIDEVTDPYGYLSIDDPFCGDRHDIKSSGGCDGTGHTYNRYGNHWCDKEIHEITIGEEIYIDTIRSGHRNQSLLGKQLKVLAVNLPFIIAEEREEGAVGRYRYPVDLRGTTIVGTSSINSGHRRNFSHQPLLDPTKLEAGDKFIVVRFDDSTDGSYRGSAFKVTDSGTFYQCGNAKKVIKAQRLSFSTHSHEFECKHGFQIIPVNDNYLCCSKSSFHTGERT